MEFVDFLFYLIFYPQNHRGDYLSSVEIFDPTVMDWSPIKEVHTLFLTFAARCNNNNKNFKVLKLLRIKKSSR